MSKNDLAVKGGRPVTSLQQRESERVRAKVIRLRDAMASNYFEMGKLLFRVNSESLYRNWMSPDGKPYVHFRDYVEKEVDFAFRKAKYLMTIWWWFAEELGDPAVTEKIKEIGWGKAAALVGIVNSKNVDKWVDKAKKLGVKELNDECRMALEAANKSRPPMRNVKVRELPETSLTKDVLAEKKESLQQANIDISQEEEIGVEPLSDEDKRTHRARWTVMLDGMQRGNIESAIDRASEVAEIEADGKGTLLDFVATSFLAEFGGSVGNNDKENQINFRNQVLSSIERLFSVNVVAFDRQSMRPIYGEKTIDRIISDGGA